MKGSAQGCGWHFILPFHPSIRNDFTLLLCALCVESSISIRDRHLFSYPYKSHPTTIYTFSIFFLFYYSCLFRQKGKKVARIVWFIKQSVVYSNCYKNQQHTEEKNTSQTIRLGEPYSSIVIWSTWKQNTSDHTSTSHTDMHTPHTHTRGTSPCTFGFDFFFLLSFNTWSVERQRGKAAWKAARR